MDRYDRQEVEAVHRAEEEENVPADERVIEVTNLWSKCKWHVVSLDEG